MVEKQSAFRILASLASETVESQTKEKQKSTISGKPFPFSNFPYF